MSRTRGASKTIHVDDGIALGKDGEPLQFVRKGPPAHPAGAVPLDRQGNPIAPVAQERAATTPRNLSGDTILHGPGAQAPPPARQIVGYRASSDSWSRQMTAHELACLLDMALQQPGDLSGGLVINISPERFAKLNGDLRLHFRPIFNDEDRDAA